MTERERWVVYPLLFLALGASLRDKFSSRTTSKLIECEELHIVDEDSPTGESPRVLASLGRFQESPDVPASGFLQISGDAKIGGQMFVQGVPLVPTWKDVLRNLSVPRGAAQQPAPRRPPAEQPSSATSPEPDKKPDK